MFDRRVLISTAAGVALVWIESGHLGLSWWSQSGFGALAGFLAGGFDLPSRGFFGGVSGALICLFIFGLAGDTYGRYMNFLAGPLLAVWILGVAGVSFLLGRSVNYAHRDV